MSDYSDKVQLVAERVVENAASPEDIRPETTLQASDYNNVAGALMALLNALGHEAQGGSTVQGRLEALEAGPVGVSELIRYVRTDGSDTADGKTPLSAKRTLTAAMESLAEETSSYDAQTNTFNPGRIYVGPGYHVQPATPVPLRGWLQIVGSGVGYGGTQIGPGEGQSGYLFDIDALDDYPNEFPHFLQLRHLTLDGRMGDGVTLDGLVKTRNAGFCCALDNVFGRNVDGIGVHLEGYAVNLLLHNTTWVDCKGGALVWDVTQDNGGVVFNGVTQIDNCGPSAIKINLTATAGVQNGLHLGGLMKFEAVLDQADEGDHKYLIDITPRPNPAIGGRFFLTGDVIDASRYRNQGEEGSRAVYERDHDNNPGTAGTYLSIRDIRTHGHYEKAAESELQGKATRGSEAHNVYWRGGWGNNAGSADQAGGLMPVAERDGVEHWQGSGAPGSLEAPNGSEWLDEDTGVVYRMVSGDWHTVDTTEVI